MKFKLYKVLNDDKMIIKSIKTSKKHIKMSKINKIYTLNTYVRV